jgi:uncharacterized lipoprotein YehR (DUF1307 family)
MKTKHGFLFGIAVLLVAAMFTFTLAGCGDGAGGGDGDGDGDGGGSLSGTLVISTTEGGAAVTEANTGATLWAVYTGEAIDVSYYWYKDGKVLGYENNIFYTTTEPGKYTVKAADTSDKSRTSAAVIVTGTMPKFPDNLVTKYGNWYQDEEMTVGVQFYNNENASTSSFSFKPAKNVTSWKNGRLTAVDGNKYTVTMDADAAIITFTATVGGDGKLTISDTDYGVLSSGTQRNLAGTYSQE